MIVTIEVMNATQVISAVSATEHDQSPMTDTTSGHRTTPTTAGAALAGTT
jgi:hypothetical protein